MHNCCYKNCDNPTHITLKTRDVTGLFDSFPLCMQHSKGYTVNKIKEDFKGNKLLEGYISCWTKWARQVRAGGLPKEDYKITLEKEKEEPLTLFNFQARTGKRFRMTKDQKLRGISREEAFKEYMREK